MNKPIRFQRRRTKGYKLPLNTKSVCRPGYFGNPFKVGQVIRMSYLGIVVLDDIAHTIENNEQAVSVYECWLHNTKKGKEVLKAAKERLKGFNLACFCPLTEKCHVDILIRVSNE